MAVVSFYATKGQDTAAAVESVSSETYLWYAAAAFGAGLVLVYFGSRLLSRRPRKKWLNILVPVLSVVVFSAGVVGLISSVMSMPYMGAYTDRLREDTVYTESFSIETDGTGAVTAQVICSNKVGYSVVIIDPDGEEIYNSDDPMSDNGVSMKKGEYTVTYVFDVPEGDAVAYDVSASVVVITTEVDISETD